MNSFQLKYWLVLPGKKLPGLSLTVVRKWLTGPTCWRQAWGGEALGDSVTRSTGQPG